MSDMPGLDFCSKFIDFLEEKGLTEDEIINITDDDLKPYYDEFVESLKSKI